MVLEEEGSKLIEMVRKNIEKYLRKNEVLDKYEIDEKIQKYTKKKRGAFVTLKTSQGKLRGCIGRPYPDKNLIDVLIDCSVSATKDPRFSPVSESELGDIRIEVTVLTEPEEIDINSIEEAEEKIEIGKHGLMIIGRGYQGLLLPQVPKEHGWDIIDFLNHSCMKAGLPGDSWKDSNVKIMRFEGQVFEE